MEINWVQLILGLASGGTTIYLIIDKLFSRKQDNAIAHGTMVASFDKEMESLRKIRLGMIEDVETMRLQVNAERDKLETTISCEVEGLKGQVESLKDKLEEEHKESKEREQLLLQQLSLVQSIVQNQSEQINKMLMYWQLLCDVDCSKRHVPVCPLGKKKVDEKSSIKK